MDNKPHYFLRFSLVMLQFFTYLLVSYSAIFFIMHVASGSPLNHETVIPLTSLESSTIALYLQAPLFSQYLSSLKNLILLNWGHSFFNSLDPLIYYVPQALFITLLFTILTVILAVFLSAFLALITVFHPKKWIRRSLLLFILLLGSLPHVVAAPMLFLFASHYVPSIIISSSWLDLPKFSTIVLLLSVPYIALFTKLLYVDLSNTPHWFHLKQLLALGFSIKQSLWQLRYQILSPISRYIGIAIPQLLSGFILVEDLFRIPALGTLSIEAINRRDYPVILVTSMIFSLSIWIFTRLATSIQHKLDPRGGTVL
ncbi:ABC transporter permease subunit [Entomospira entomophila]|uniref:ABC transporter permease subunit n=1 Tax=Entomospira entomophila TaxID=2719988 RepID=A0A968KWB2_9SPIO|nr:ABC transporter permease subunit [Entomospira entomophilus]NIZ40650.1 ABC transporter permease subunit [Entomospira entomophilus]WDI34864.1 ABC transporter permease subunit [Entomospira entomophilus]